MNTFKTPQFCVFLFITFCFSSLISEAVAQKNVLAGRVLDAETGMPMQGVHVFFDKTTIGTITNEGGRFRLAGFQDGDYMISASFIGFETFTVPVSIPEDNTATFKISLNPKVFETDVVMVTEKTPKEWLKNLQKFENLFLGETLNADHTKIKNPEVLEFFDDGSSFKAEATEPLVIENNALGYEITYFLTEFKFNNSTISTKATSKFRELQAKDPETKARWIEERKRAYLGSFKHFLDALDRGSTNEDGFRIFYQATRSLLQNQYELKPQPVENPQNLITKLPGELRTVELKIDKQFPYLRVEYIHVRPEQRIAERYNMPRLSMNQISFISFPNRKAVLDLQTTNSTNRYVPLFYGYWGWTSRVPELLPQDFVISDNI